MRELYELKEKLVKELKAYGDRDKLDASSLQIVDTLAHSIKNICKIIESYEMEENGYSNGYDGGPYNSYNSYARGRGVNARRNSLGQYSSMENNGYSRAEDGFRMDLQNLMQSAPNDYVRQKLMEVANGV